MQILPSGLPIHADATIRLRPRIFLEGNFYADLHPGSPSAPVLRPGATLAAANTSGPVQLDRVLSSLNSDSRTDLQTLLRGLGSSLNEPPSATDPTPGPAHPLADRRPGAQPVAAVLGRRVPGLVDRQPGAARHEPRRPDQGGPGQRAGVPLARRRRPAAPGLHQHVRRHDGDAGRSPDPAPADDLGPAAAARSARRAPTRRSTARSRRRSRSPTTSSPGCASSTRRSVRRCRGWPRRRRWPRRPSCAGCSPT